MRTRNFAIELTMEDDGEDRCHWEAAVLDADEGHKLFTLGEFTLTELLGVLDEMLRKELEDDD